MNVDLTTLKRTRAFARRHQQLPEKGIARRLLEMLSGCLVINGTVCSGPGASVQAQSVQGTAEKQQLAPIFSTSAAPITLPSQGSSLRTFPSLHGSSAQTGANSPSLNGAAPQTGSNLPGSNLPTINCRLPVHKIGSLQLDDAQAVIEQGSVYIRASYMGPSAEPLLRGRVIRLDDAGTASGAMRKMSGLVLFHSGQMLGQLNEGDGYHSQFGVAPIPMEEFIFRKTGSLSGQILSVSGDQMTVCSRGLVTTIPLDSVSYVRSPRAFLFTISGTPSSDQSRTQVQDVAFQPTVTAQALGDQVVVGRRADDPLLDDDEPLFPQQPRAITRMRQLESDATRLMPGRIFPNWP